ncbi:MAG TPA: acyltransferase [Chthoniobacterales bacterium]|nr:acyltransferase [Chthoniobacterales bacterium]
MDRARLASYSKWLWKDNLAGHLDNRANNITLLRLCLATMVLYGHSFAVSGEAGSPLLFSRAFGKGSWIGATAVNLFFFVSGLLITRSYAQRKNFADYFWARFQRIYPANAVCTVLCVFLLGTVFTAFPLWQYLTDPNTYRHLFSNLFLWRVSWVLPGLFTTHKMTAVNGSLWSLPVELRCYFVVGIIGLLGGLKARWTMNLTLLVLLVVGLTEWRAIPMMGESAHHLRAVTYFAVGSFCFANARYVVLSRVLCLGLIFCCYYWFGAAFYPTLFSVTSCYTLLILAYRVPYTRMNEWGDFSYGMYIYAFPVQQMWVQLFPTWKGYQNALAAFPSTLLLAMLSWFFVEKPAIAWRRAEKRRAKTKTIAAEEGQPPPISPAAW